MLKAMHEKLLFLYKFGLAPKQIGSVTPSSIFLAKKMLEEVPWHQIASIAELGAGTGAITKYMDELLLKKTKVLLFEKDAEMRSHLSNRFSEYGCFEDACQLKQALKVAQLDELDCILSGLPFFNFPAQQREQLMQEITTALKPRGLFIAFQYSQQMRKQLSQNFEIKHIHFVPLNVPPAFVYVCKKKETIHHEL